MTMQQTQTEYKKYEDFINEKVWEQFGPSYCTPSLSGNKWRTTIPYSYKIADFLMLQTRVWLRLIEYKGSATDQWDFMTKLTNQITEFLVTYFVRNAGLSGRSDSDKQKWATEYIRGEIVNRFVYMQRLKTQSLQEQAAQAMVASANQIQK